MFHKYIPKCYEDQWSHITQSFPISSYRLGCFFLKYSLWCQAGTLHIMGKINMEDTLFIGWKYFKVSLITTSLQVLIWDIKGVGHLYQNPQFFCNVPFFSLSESHKRTKKKNNNLSNIHLSGCVASSVTIVYCLKVYKGLSHTLSYTHTQSYRFGSHNYLIS